MSATLPTADLILTNISPEQWSYQIVARQQLLGRGPDADIRVPRRFTTVSRRHAQVWSDSHGLWIHDLGSLLGTRVNGVEVEGMDRAVIVVGDRIWLGGAQLEVVPHVSRSAAVASRPRPGKDLRLTQTMRLPVGGPPEIDLLTVAEREVVLWMCRGLLDDEAIAKKLKRSPNTVRTHVGSIFKKLGLHSRGDVVNVLRKLTTTPHPVRSRSLVEVDPAVKESAHFLSAH